MKREALITPTIEKFLKQNKMYCNWEIKQTTSDSIAFNAISDHQVESLLAAQDEGITWKYSDADSRIKPFDGSTNPPLIGYVIIKFPKAVTYITINNFVHCRDTIKRKSLTFEKACDIANKIMYL